MKNTPPVPPHPPQAAPQTGSQTGSQTGPQIGPEPAPRPFGRPRDAAEERELPVGPAQPAASPRPFAPRPAEQRPGEPRPAEPRAAEPRPFERQRNFDGEREVPVGPAPRPRDDGGAWPAATAVELGDAPKALFVMGPGRSGKTTLLRYVMEKARPGRAAPIAAALDPQNRSLATFLGEVVQPDTVDPVGVARWAEELLGHVMTERQSALLDMGGGDLSMGRLLEDVPDLAGSLEDAGVHPVAIYTLSPRVDDLGVLAGYEAQGFRPRATALVLNAGIADPSLPREEAFGRVIRHSAFRAAVERGAVPIWMPRLDAGVAAEIEGKRLRFGQARDGVAPPDQPGAVLGPFDRSRVRRWMSDMAAALLPIRSWIP